MNSIRTVVITGASSGIGHATARLLDEKGYRVFAGARKDADLERLAKLGSERLIPVRLDITVPEHIAATLQQVEAAAPEGIDALINNAGTIMVGPLELLPLDTLRRQIEINVVGHLAMIQAFLPLVRRGKGRIINVTSANGRFAFPMIGAYCTSKFAMEGLSDALRRELRPFGIPVVIIEPGTVEAPIWDHEDAQVENVLSGISPEARAMYEVHGRNVNDMMQQGRRCAVAPSALAETIHRALIARRPWARYQRGPGAVMSGIGACMPDWLTDWTVDQIVKKKLSTRFLGW